MHSSQRGAFSINLHRILSFLLALALVVSFVCLLPPRQAQAASPSPPIEYNKVMTRYYKSSVDGVTLPCNVYVPNKGWWTPVRLPVWVDLHAYGGPGGVSGYMKQVADTYGVICVAPWGRNYRSFYADGTDNPASPEPCIVDDFNNNDTSQWTPAIGNQWSASGGAHIQSDMSDAWKVSTRAASVGSNYTASADIKALDSSSSDGYNEYTAGLMVRRQANGDCYLVDLDCTNSGKKYVRMYRFKGGRWTLLGLAQLPDTFDLKQSHNLKVVCFGDTVVAQVDLIQVASFQDTSFLSGGVAVGSFGGKHQFDNVRVQNETLYGERDTLDCINQALEDLSLNTIVQWWCSIRADTSKVYLSGASMGGLGAWILGVHYPDFFACLHPGYGPTDLTENYNWIKAQYPDQNGLLYAREQDSNIAESINTLNGGLEPDQNVGVTSNMHEYSARYVLENALNMPVRIEHPEYDTLVPNATKPMTIKWLRIDKRWVVVKSGAQRPTPSYAQAQGIWQTWASTPGLYNCVPETNLYDSNGNKRPETATLGIWDNTDYSANLSYTYGAHCAAPIFSDTVAPNVTGATNIWLSFKRQNKKYASLHNDPNDVANRTYDNKHNGVWWLTMEIAYPDQDKPGLARIHRDTAANKVNVHVKNMKTTTLDVKRMKIDTSTAGKILTVTVDANTAPESEFKITDTFHKTDLKLVGEWYPASKGQYQVSLDGKPVAFDMTGTALTIPNVDTTSGTRTVAVTIPAGLQNMLASANSGFESGTTGWTKQMYSGTLNGIFELNSEAFFNHSGTRSIRIKDALATAAPYMGSWQSGAVTVQGGKTYTISAFAKTRNLNSVSRTFENGKYSPGSNSSAEVGILWLKANGAVAGWTTSQGIRDTTDWTPLELSAQAPAGATQARAVLLTVCPNNQGTTGSAWFDDVALRLQAP